MLAAGLLAKKAVERGLHGQAARQDLARARLARGHRLPQQDRPAAAISTSSASTSSATAAPPASATPARSTPASRRRSRRTISSPRPCCPATATSRRASTRTSRPTSSRRRRWWSPSPSRARVDIDLTSEPLGSGKDGDRSTCRDIWPTLAGGRRPSSSSALRSGNLPRALRRFRHGQSAVERHPARDRQGLQLGPASHLHPGAAVLRRTSRCTTGNIGDIHGARPLGIFGDSVTTDHISPAGSDQDDLAGRQVPAGQRRRRRGLQQLRLAPRQ